ncbi:hypothetical protein C1T17_08055 [Sphingobium sp. SCG-1]|nr:hypothetical protein C1T17_08055 [Sphingobium sp. SCG-1]
MRIGLVVFVFVLANPVMASPDNHSSKQPGGALIATEIPPLKLDQPNWRPMTGQQISAAFRGRALYVDEAYRPYPNVKVKTFWMGGCPPSEHFAANGVWTRSECHRARKSYFGRWETERFRGGERLCVEAPNFPKLCRFVWLGAAGDRVFMAADKLFWEEPMDDPRTFNPYLLVVAH